MSKNILYKRFFLVLVFFSSLKSYASLEESFYVKGEIGISLPNKINNYNFYNSKKPKNSRIYGIGFGCNFNDKFRSDLSISYINNHLFDDQVITHTKEDDIIHENFIKQNFSSTEFMVNGYYKFLEKNSFSTYFNAGLGMALNKAGDYISKNKNLVIKGGRKLNLAWNVGLGVSYEITPLLNVDLSYKYNNSKNFSTSDTYIDRDAGSIGHRDTIKARFNTNVIYLGLRYKL